MSHELSLRLRFVTTDAMVAFLSSPPSGVQIMGSRGEVAAGRTRKASSGHTLTRWTDQEDETLIEYWTSRHNGSADTLTAREAEKVAEQLGRSPSAVQARLRTLLAKG